MTFSVIRHLLSAQAVSDGAGVKIYRSIGLNPNLRLDPFLMLDCFGSDNPNDYIAGFPPHPHRGFETVTYMLDGHMLHEDHLGNRGHLKSGGVQWMTAGRGIIHSEMPQQESGLMRGFQLWINLPAAEKMKAAAYVDLEPSQIPTVQLPTGIVKVIAGTMATANDLTVEGPVRGLSTEPRYFDAQMTQAGDMTFELTPGHNSIVYPYQGAVRIGDQTVGAHQAAILTSGTKVQVHFNSETRFIVLSAKPIGEPVVQYGPFVMNTTAEIEQAIRDYQQGRLTDGAAATKVFS